MPLVPDAFFLVVLMEPLQGIVKNIIDPCCHLLLGPGLALALATGSQFLF